MTSSRASRFPANPANAGLAMHDGGMGSALFSVTLSPRIDRGPSGLSRLALP